MNSFYHSTRGKTDNVTSKQAILRGIAPDGGLYVADWIGEEKLDLAQVCNQTFQQNARLVLGGLLPDFTAGEIADCVSAAYGEQWTPPRAARSRRSAKATGCSSSATAPRAPSRTWRCRCCPACMSAPAAPSGDERDHASSPPPPATPARRPSTASPTCTGIGISVFYPRTARSPTSSTSRWSRRSGDNVAVCRGARQLRRLPRPRVKRIFGDAELAERMRRQRRLVLSSANSINVGRLRAAGSLLLRRLRELRERGRNPDG